MKGVVHKTSVLYSGLYYSSPFRIDNILKNHCASMYVGECFKVIILVTLRSHEANMLCAICTFYTQNTPTDRKLRQILRAILLEFWLDYLFNTKSLCWHLDDESTQKNVH